MSEAKRSELAAAQGSASSRYGTRQEIEQTIQECDARIAAPGYCEELSRCHRIRDTLTKALSEPPEAIEPNAEMRHGAQQGE
jgi:hypothetical protein